MHLCAITHTHMGYHGLPQNLKYKREFLFLFAELPLKTHSEYISNTNAL